MSLVLVRLTPMYEGDDVWVNPAQVILVRWSEGQDGVVVHLRGRKTGLLVEGTLDEVTDRLSDDE